MVTKKLESSQFPFILSYEFRLDVGLPSLFSNSTEYPLVVVGPLSANADDRYVEMIYYQLMYYHYKYKYIHYPNYLF
jgi:hypothetical protein